MYVFFSCNLGDVINVSFSSLIHLLDDFVFSSIQLAGSVF